VIPKNLLNQIPWRFDDQSTIFHDLLFDEDFNAITVLALDMLQSNEFDAVGL